jgi:large subunit ribosomal protein L24
MVVVLQGRERGKRGRVKRVYDNGRVQIENVMKIQRHTRPSQKNPQGGIVEKEGTVPVSNVALWCEKCGKPRRAHAVIDDKGQKTRSCVKCESPFVASAL